MLTVLRLMLHDLKNHDVQRQKIKVHSYILMGNTEFKISHLSILTSHIPVCLREPHLSLKARPFGVYETDPFGNQFANVAFISLK